MTELVTDLTETLSADALVLDSDLAAMACLPEWVEAVAARHGLSEKARFAANLCLEEAVSNSIRHGYRGVRGSQVRVFFTGLTPHGWGFTVEDDAPRFNPLEKDPLPAISLETLVIGGQGIRLMKAFATSFTYEQTPTGNRLHFAFAQTDDAAGDQTDTPPAA
jgi:serine/threonine-protein kinase RsbW